MFERALTCSDPYASFCWIASRDEPWDGKIQRQSFFKVARPAYTDLVQLPKRRTPLAADLECPANLRSKIIIAAAPIGSIEPSTWCIDSSNVLEISRSGRVWRGAQAIKVSCGVFTAD